jgi:mRNA degradation ribonuclease J1/J2
LPKEKDGEWQIPDGEKGLHASGPACGTDLLAIVKNIGPNTLIPVHSENPELYIKYLEDCGINVFLPKVGGSIDVKN